MEYVWLGMTDAQTEGRWVRTGEGAAQQVAPSSGRNESGASWKIPWEIRPKEPNGGRKENCAAMKKGQVNKKDGTL